LDRLSYVSAVDSIRQSGAAEIAGIVADITTPDGVDFLFRQVPGVDILVNNLGIYESKPFAEITDADWQRYFNVNVMSGVRLARRYFPLMLEKKAGRVIFVSSETGLAVDPGMIHYAMTKTAQLAIARGFAGLTKGTAVTVNAVLPGPTRSEGIGDSLRSVATKPNATDEDAEAEFFATARSGSLLQRLIEAEEIANMVAFLASPLSAATNGAAIRVEGGLINSLA
jgi:NAD(P)-dependent dehydrogenase (short-subunit alcohol dehydrogenase family)